MIETLVDFCLDIQVTVTKFFEMSGQILKSVFEASFEEMNWLEFEQSYDEL